MYDMDRKTQLGPSSRVTKGVQVHLVPNEGPEFLSIKVVSHYDFSQNYPFFQKFARLHPLLPQYGRRGFDYTIKPIIPDFSCTPGIEKGHHWHLPPILKRHKNMILFLMVFVGVNKCSFIVILLDTALP
jgi:hypothetical protein